MRLTITYFLALIGMMVLVGTRKMIIMCQSMMCGSHLQRHHEQLQRGPHECVVGLVWLCMHAAGPCMGKSQACRRTIMRNDLGAEFPGAIVILLAQQCPIYYYYTMRQKITMAPQS
jgi:hypothetical protein